MVIRTALRENDPAVDDDRTVPVPGAGVEFGEQSPIHGTVDIQAGLRIVDVKQPAGDDRTRARTRVAPGFGKGSIAERPGDGSTVIGGKDPCRRVLVPHGWGCKE